MCASMWPYNSKHAFMIDYFVKQCFKRHPNFVKHLSMVPEFVYRFTVLLSKTRCNLRYIHDEPPMQRTGDPNRTVPFRNLANAATAYVGPSPEDVSHPELTK